MDLRISIALLLLAFLFGMLHSADASTDCIVDVDASSWYDTDTESKLNRKGLKLSNYGNEDFRIQVDEFKSRPISCFFGCDYKQEIIMVMTITDKEGNILFLKNKKTMDYKYNKQSGLRVYERSSYVNQTKKDLILSAPNCTALKFAAQ